MGEEEDFQTEELGCVRTKDLTQGYQYKTAWYLYYEGMRMDHVNGT